MDTTGEMLGKLICTQVNQILNTPCQDGGEIGGHPRSKEKGTRFLGCFAFILLNLDFSCHTSCWSTQTAAKQANSAPVNWLPYVLGGLFAWVSAKTSIGFKVALGFCRDFCGRYRSEAGLQLTEVFCLHQVAYIFFNVLNMFGHGLRVFNPPSFSRPVDMSRWEEERRWRWQRRLALASDVQKCELVWLG